MTNALADPLTHEDSNSEEASPFALEDLFFSTTNLRGFITSCNPVFIEVSHFDIADLIGSPHSIVRHPDMPRAVFKILWDSLKAGQPLAAYVKNRTADGRYYWVMAIAIPIKSGYLSIRLKPSTPIQAKVESAYRAVRSRELAMEAEGKPRSEILEKSVPALLGRLADLGFSSYDAFQHVALPSEIASRRVALGMDHGSPDSITSRIDHEHTDDMMDPDLGIAAANRQILAWTSNLFDNLDDLIAANEVLARRSHFLLDLARSIHIFALNAGLSSSILGAEGHALEAVTKQLQGTSKDIVRTIELATTGVEEAIRLIRSVGFMIAISTLQSEMVDFVTTDSEEVGSPEANQTERVGASETSETLIDALGTSIQTVFELSDTIANTVAGVSTGSQSLFSLLDLLQFELLAGRIEIARLADRRGFNDMFSEISNQLIEAETEIKRFGEETQSAATLIDSFDLQKGHEVLAHLIDSNRP